jgi:SHAQKYF class myb-like DNA-binding protein
MCHSYSDIDGSRSSSRAAGLGVEGNRIGQWTESEQAVFVQGLGLYGNDWKAIRGLLPSRTLTQIRTHAHKWGKKCQQKERRQAALGELCAEAMAAGVRQVTAATCDSNGDGATAEAMAEAMAEATAEAMDGVNNSGSNSGSTSGSTRGSNSGSAPAADFAFQQLLTQTQAPPDASCGGSTGTSNTTYWQTGRQHTLGAVAVGQHTLGTLGTTGSTGTGTWTEHECALFRAGLQRFGRDWKKVKTAVTTRSLTQIRSHAQKYFKKVESERRKIAGGVGEEGGEPGSFGEEGRQMEGGAGPSNESESESARMHVAVYTTKDSSEDSSEELDYSQLDNVQSQPRVESNESAGPSNERRGCLGREGRWR